MEGSATSITQALEPELAHAISQVDEISGVARRLVDGLHDAQLSWRPAADRWSIADCLSHLETTTSSYLPSIDRALERGRAAAATGRGPFRHGFLGNWLVRTFEPPARVRLRSPRVFRPPPTADPRTVLATFLQSQDALTRRIRGADGLHLARVKVVSPVTPLLKLSVGQCFRLLAAHQRRHLWQAQRVRDAVGFPEA